MIKLIGNPKLQFFQGYMKNFDERHFFKVKEQPEIQAAQSH